MGHSLVCVCYIDEEFAAPMDICEQKLSLSAQPLTKAVLIAETSYLFFS